MRKKLAKCTSSQYGRSSEGLVFRMGKKELSRHTGNNNRNLSRMLKGSPKNREWDPGENNQHERENVSLVKTSGKSQP